MHGYTYKTTNLLNNKVYIGQKKSANFVSLYTGSGKLIKRAVHKYGVNCFKVELLAEAHNQESLDILERYYIKVYDATNMIKGYNIATGGSNGNLGVHWSKEARANMRKAHIGCWDIKPHPQLGTFHSEETKRKIGLKSIGRFKHQTEEHKQAIRNHWIEWRKIHPNIDRLCACGCGNAFSIRPVDKQRFIKGHHRRDLKFGMKGICVNA